MEDLSSKVSRVNLPTVFSANNLMQGRQGPALARDVVSDKLAFSPKAGVAQLVEQLIRNQQVIGSSPIAGSSFPRGPCTSRLDPSHDPN
jgi:hypothetical protein